MSRARVIARESTGRRILEQSRVRLMCIGFLFVLCYGSIGVRMVEVALLKGPHGKTITVSDPDSDENEQVSVREEAGLSRGDIVDRNGVLLATSLMTASLYANPKELRHPDVAARALQQTLGMDAKLISKRLSSNRSFVWIKRNLSPREQQAVNSLGIPGLYFSPEERRVYPFGATASHVVGYVGVDGKGLGGLEQSQDARLKDDNVNTQPLKLTLDVRVQAIMHEELQKAMSQTRAVGGVGVVADAKTGELISMVSLPDFDPNQPGRAASDATFNRAVQGVYEMGSTFKSFTLAMALEEGLVSMRSRYDVSGGVRVANFTVRDAHPKKPQLTVPEIFAYSSNVGTAKIALEAGGKRLHSFLDTMGFTKPLMTELSERASPLVPKEWRDVNVVTVSYGHGISVTPLHVVRGIAALVNGGTLPRLTLLGGTRHEPDARDVVSATTSQNMRRMMRLVVEHGTGGKADVEGYRVGGKTGTAEKLTAGGYSEHSNLSSFVAAFPIDAPQYVMLIMLDDPKSERASAGGTTGGAVAAPVAGRVIERMSPLLALAPAFDPPGDDAQKFWVNDETSKPTYTHYVRQASY